MANKLVMISNGEYGKVWREGAEGCSGVMHGVMNVMSGGGGV